MIIAIGKILFACCVALLVYSYIGYPFLAWMLARLRRREEVNEQFGKMRVTVIIAAYNEGSAIAERLSDIFRMSLLPDEVIVASDGSVDETNEIVSRWADKGVRLLALPRVGRATAHNHAVASATGDVVVFTDAETSFEMDFLANIIQAFKNPTVGCAVGRLVYLANRHTIAEYTVAYWQYETKLREWESDAGLLSVGSGCCMAVRRKLYRNLHADEDGDDAIPLDVLLQGYRVTLVPQALAFDFPPSTMGDEIRARARMTVLAWTAILWRRALLNPFRFPHTALALLSHRFLRFLTPVLVSGAFSTNTLLLGESPYWLTFGLALLLLVSAFLGWLGDWGGRVSVIFRASLSFFVWNIGFAAGLVMIARGQTLTSYAPVRSTVGTKTAHK